MSGLLLMGVLAVWLVIAFVCATLVGALFKTKWLRIAVSILLFAAMLPLPVADELLAKPAFDKLCDEGTRLKFDPEKIRGKTMAFKEMSQPSISVGGLSGYTIPWRLVDARTSDELISYNTFYLKGGVLIRTLGISDSNAPLTMSGYCGPSEHPSQANFRARWNLQLIDSKDVK